jgi:hypothetical protein
VASMSRTSTKVLALEVMGRHAGWMTPSARSLLKRKGAAAQFHQRRRLRYQRGGPPILGAAHGEAYPPFKNGLPEYVKLQNAAAPKKLSREFAV